MNSRGLVFDLFNSFGKALSKLRFNLTDNISQEVTNLASLRKMVLLYYYEYIEV